jgi:hypothetical protein
LSLAWEIAANSSLNVDGGKSLNNGVGGGVGTIKLALHHLLCQIISSSHKFELLFYIKKSQF